MGHKKLTKKRVMKASKGLQNYRKLKSAKGLHDPSDRSSRPRSIIDPTQINQYNIDEFMDHTASARDNIAYARTGNLPGSKGQTARQMLLSGRNPFPTLSMPRHLLLQSLREWKDYVWDTPKNDVAYAARTDGSVAYAARTDGSVGTAVVPPKAKPDRLTDAQRNMILDYKRRGKDITPGFVVKTNKNGTPTVTFTGGNRAQWIELMIQNNEKKTQMKR